MNPRRYILIGAFLFAFINLLFVKSLIFTSRDDDQHSTVASKSNSHLYYLGDRSRLSPGWAPGHSSIARMHVANQHLTGSPRRAVDIVFGVPTRLRDGAPGGPTGYLEGTLRSLVENAGVDKAEGARNLRRMLIVVFVAETETSRIERVVAGVARAVDAQYVEHSPLIEIVHADLEAYPSFANIPLLHNDTYERVQWRARQCIDYALMLDYARGRGAFYMQLEDDVIASPDYFRQTLNFIAEQKILAPAWVLLETTRLGFIGKIIHDHDLDELAVVFRLFYREQPVDFLLLFWLRVKQRQPERIFRYPSLFEHVGHVSTLKGKVQDVVDANALGGMPFPPRMHTSRTRDNPTTRKLSQKGLETFREYAWENAYLGLGYFWGKGVSTASESYLLAEFASEALVKRVLCETGHESRADNILRAAVVEVLEAGRGEWQGVAAFDSRGRAMSHLESPVRALAVRIRLLKPQKEWIIVTLFQVDHV